MVRIVTSLLPIILISFLLSSCGGQLSSTQVDPEMVYTNAAETAAVLLTETSVAGTKTAISWTPTPDVTSTPIPDAVVIADTSDTCYPIWDDLPQEYQTTLIMRGEGECLSVDDSFTILGQLNHCEYLKVHTAGGVEGWIRGPAFPDVSSAIHFNKTCDEIKAIYLRPQNGSYTSYGNSLLFGSTNVLELKYFLQESFYWCSVTPCFISDIYLGVLRVFNYTDSDAMLILSPYDEHFAPLFSQAMYIQAGQAVDFPICNESVNRSIRPWVTPEDLNPADVHCFAYSDTGQYRVFATTGQDWDDVDNHFDNSPLYWSISTVVKVSKPVATHPFRGNVEVFGWRSLLSDYYSIDYDIVVIHPDNIEEYYENNRIYGLGTVSQDEFPSP